MRLCRVNGKQVNGRRLAIIETGPMRTLHWLLIPVAAALLGCDQSSSSSANTPSQTSTAAPADSAPKEIPANSPVPAGLKTTAYEYYGLDNRQPLPMKETDADTVKTGTAVTAIVSVAKDKAVFNQSWTGDLAQLGDSEVEATKDGIFATSLYGQTLPKPQLDLPANPQPGSTWTFQASVQGPNGEDIQEQGSDKVVGVEKLQIGNKTYDALRVEEQGTSSVNQKEYKDTATRWYVKGLGAVKLETNGVSGSETQHQVIVADLN